MSTSTIRLHRVLRASPERAYRAFLNAEALSKWLPPNGFTCKVHQLEPKVGGTHKMSFTNFTTGNGHSFGGRYLDRFERRNGVWRIAHRRAVLDVGFRTVLHIKGPEKKR